MVFSMHCVMGVAPQAHVEAHARMAAICRASQTTVQSAYAAADVKSGGVLVMNLKRRI